MRRNRKLTNAIIAAMFAASPLLTLAPTNNIQAATNQTTVSAIDIHNHFLQNIKAFENGKQVSANVFINNLKLNFLTIIS